MEGIVKEISHGFYKVESDGIIYETFPQKRWFSPLKVKVNDLVILDDETFQIIEILHSERK